MSKPSAWPTRTPRISSANISDYLKAVLESIGATADKEHDGELKLNPITRAELLDSKGPSGPKNKAKHTEMTINAGTAANAAFHMFLVRLSSIRAPAEEIDVWKRGGGGGAGSACSWRRRCRVSPGDNDGE